MYLLDAQLDSVAEQLALDEALLEQAEQAAAPGDILRVWESPQLAVVVGRASRVAEEVNRSWCEAQGIPVLRRTTGGTAVTLGPGCLVYSLILGCAAHPQLRVIDAAHAFVLKRIAEAVADPRVQQRGISDLALGDDKISGNSMRRGRQAILYHGTLLYDFPLTTLNQALGQPPRQPDYRDQRPHDQFVTNLACDARQLRRRLIEVWQADRPLARWPVERVRQLVAQRYDRDDWNFRR